MGKPIFRTQNLKGAASLDLFPSVDTLCDTHFDARRQFGSGRRATKLSPQPNAGFMLSVDRLSKSFPRNGRSFNAVDEVTFHVAAGEVYGLLGPNGAGKTTTLRCVLGLLEPTSGDVVVDGFGVAQQPDEVKRRIGLVSASAGLYQWLTPREILHYFADAYSVPPQAAGVRVDELSDLLQLGAFLDQRSATLSTGQKQRVNLARALIHDPPVVLMDEPTLGLDVVGSQVVLDYVSLLRSQQRAVVISTHHLDEAGRLCDRFGLLHQGRLRNEGTLEELREQTGEPGLVEMFVAMLRPEPLAGSAP
jgi:ABC-2 type transport system ATP-binding protein/sodium transport system ATP-binding protein